jgi:PII-like signaling protein
MDYSAVLLRVYTEEARRSDGRPLYEEIVLRARAAGLAGATVLRGPMGYGSGGKLHTAKIIDLSANLPLVIEIVDAEDKIRAFATQLNEIADLGLMTLERVEVLRWGRKG